MVKGKGGKDRPRSSATKRKKAGSPDGSDIPLEGQLTTLENYHQPPIVDVIRGPTVEELLITENEMISKRPQVLTPPSKLKKSIEVRKKHVISTNPTKTISVLKKVDAALPDVAVQSAGPRYNSVGEILPYSILGPVDQFQSSMIARGNTDLIDKPVFQGTKGPQPIHITSSPIPDYFEETKEEKALKNWEQQLRQHSKQMDLLAKKTGKDSSNLLMARTNEYRVKQEERTIIDRAIPVVDRGKGFRVGSEFWSQPQQIGGSDSAIVMTLNQSEQGQHPEIERIGHPYWNENLAAHSYPWKRNKFFENRRKELSCVLSEQEPHLPDFGGLCVEGKKELYHKISEAVLIEAQETTTESVVQTKPETDVSKLTEEKRQGPILEINGVESQWGPKSRDPTIVRVLFTSDAGAIATQHIHLKNTGTTAIFYAWKQIPKENKLNTIMEGNKQRFYFSINDGVILPGEEQSIPLIFLSKNPGIYTESWQFITKPVLNDGAPIVVTLKGVALKRDIYKQEKEQIEKLLEKRQTSYNVKLLVEELVRGVHTPPPPSPPPPAGPSLPEKFNINNPYMYYQSDYYAEAEELWRDVVGLEGPPWDESIASIRREILKLSPEAQVEKIEEFNKLRAKLTQPRMKPVTEEAYDLCYGCLRAAVDTMEGEDRVLRKRLSVPERVHVEEPPPAEPDATSEKTAPDSKKAKKDGDKKKESKPGSKRSHQAESKPARATSKSSKKSDQQLVPEEEPVDKKEWEEITDPVLKTKYREKLTIMVHNVLTTCIDHITLALEEELEKPF